MSSGAQYNRWVSAERTEDEVAKTVAQNFIKKFGKPKFLRFIAMLQNNESGEKIAYEFEVSRQRVHQWKIQLGQEKIMFNLRPSIEEMLGISTAGRKTV